MLRVHLNTPQNPGWIARILLAITTLALVIVGFFFLTIALVAGTLIALVGGARLWWTIRQLKRTHPDMGTVNSEDHRSSEAQVNRDGALDGEYQVVERESSAPKLPPEH